MTIQVELNPEMEAQLTAEAKAHGMDLQRYAVGLLQQAMASKLSQRSRASQEEFRSFLDELASNAPDVPGLLDEKFSRGMIYGDHA